MDDVGEINNQGLLGLHPKLFVNVASDPIWSTRMADLIAHLSMKLEAFLVKIR